MRIVLKEGMKFIMVLDQMSHCVCTAPGLSHGPVQHLEQAICTFVYMYS